MYVGKDWIHGSGHLQMSLFDHFEDDLPVLVEQNAALYEPVINNMQKVSMLVL